MLTDNLFEDIPYLRLKLFNHFLCLLNVMCSSVRNKLFHNERLKQLDRHLLWKTALINLKLRTYNDNGTSGIVNTLT